MAECSQLGRRVSSCQTILSSRLLVEVPDASSFREGHDEHALIADHQRYLVGCEAPLAVHLSLFLMETGALAQRTSQLAAAQLFSPQRDAYECIIAVM